MTTNYTVERTLESFYDNDRILISQDGELLYCACGSVVNVVRIEDGTIQERITIAEGEDPVVKFTVTSDDKLLIIAYHSQLIRKYSLTGEHSEKFFKSIHKHRITYLKCNPSRTLLATGSSDSTIKIWNLINHYCTHNLKGINGVISCIEFYEDSKNNVCHIYCSGGDDVIQVFDLNAQGARLYKLKAHSSTVTSIQVLSGEHLALTAGRDKIAVLWDLSKCKTKASGPEMSAEIRRTIPLFESIESMTLISPELVKKIPSLKKVTDPIFATVGEAGVVRLWNAMTGAKVLEQGESGLSQDMCPKVSCFQLCVRPRHKQLAVVTFERSIHFYKLSDFSLVQQLQGHVGEILSACFIGPKQDHLVLASNTSTLSLFELASSRYQQLEGHKDIVVCVKSFPDDPMMMISSSKDCNIIVWKFKGTEALKGEILFKAAGHTQSVTSIIPYNLCTRFFSASEDTTLKLWSVDSSKIDDIDNRPLPLVANVTIKAHDQSIDALAIAPYDDLVATGSRDKAAKVYRITHDENHKKRAALREFAVFKGHKRGIWAVQFSPSDRILATSSGDATIKLWNLLDQCCLTTLQGHDCSVLNLQFISKGLQILSVSSDGNMKIWDCKTNECTKTIDAHQGRIWCLLLAENQKRLITGGDDSTLKLWRDVTEEEKELSRIHSQNLTVQEQNFMNYASKRKWLKALKIAILMENVTKSHNVFREILLETTGLSELKNLLQELRPDQLEFILRCVITWNSNTRTSHLAQSILHSLLLISDPENVRKDWASEDNLSQLISSTEKHYNRYSRLLQQATFVDFLYSSLKFRELNDTAHHKKTNGTIMDC